ncbi:MAG: hypothetical protein KH230_13740 [Enterocloster asparagiformis]|nr:hypothetical protein [Enterocloster asparagiformis]
MGQFVDESNILINAGRTSTRGNWVSVEWDGFEIRLSDNDRVAISQAKLKEMCIKCLNELFG